MREDTELYGLPDEEQYVKILISECGAVRYPNQADAYILESRPFYAPRFADDHISILSFNNIPLPDSLIDAFVVHAELFSDEIVMCWTQEQDLIFEATLGQLRGRTVRDSRAAQSRAIRSRSERMNPKERQIFGTYPESLKAIAQFFIAITLS